MTQDELAERAGLERSQLSKIEREKEPASTRRLFAIAEALGVSVPELFEVSGDEDACRVALLSLLPELGGEDREALLAHARALAAMRKAQTEA